MQIIIKGEFPTLNEVIKVSKSHHMAYANQKKDYTALALIHLENVHKIDYKADWSFTWYRKNRRNDPDNRHVRTKYIFEAYVKKEMNKNVGGNEINSITHKFEVDKDNPRVEINIRSLE